jgi:hypothetical protein
MSDNATPQPNYWVHRSYAELGTRRITTVPAQARTVALAGEDTLNHTLKIIAGRYYNPNLGSHNAPSNVELKIRNYTYAANTTLPLIIQRIPSNNVPYSVPCYSPQTIFNGTVTFAGDSASIMLNGFVDGDVYIIYINPSPGNILGVQQQESNSTNKITVSPNPATDMILIESNEDIMQSISIHDLNGRTVLSQNVSPTACSVNVSFLAPGVYTLNVYTETEQVKSKLIIAR